VQAKLSEQATNHKATRMKSEALLAGHIFDDRGNRMSPTYAWKKGIKYRYYLSSALLQGNAERAGSMQRVPAAEIEHLVLSAVRNHLKLSAPIDDRSFIANRCRSYCSSASSKRDTNTSHSIALRRIRCPPEQAANMARARTPDDRKLTPH